MQIKSEIEDNPRTCEAHYNKMVLISVSKAPLALTHDAHLGCEVRTCAACAQFLCLREFIESPNNISQIIQYAYAKHTNRKTPRRAERQRGGEWKKEERGDEFRWLLVTLPLLFRSLIINFSFFPSSFVFVFYCMVFVIIFNFVLFVL